MTQFSATLALLLAILAVQALAGPQLTQFSQVVEIAAATIVGKGGDAG